MVDVATKCIYCNHPLTFLDQQGLEWASWPKTNSHYENCPTKYEEISMSEADLDDEAALQQQWKPKTKLVLEISFESLLHDDILSEILAVARVYGKVEKAIYTHLYPITRDIKSI